MHVDEPRIFVSRFRYKGSAFVFTRRASLFTDGLRIISRFLTVPSAMPLHDFDTARAIHAALVAAFSRSVGGASDPVALSVVTRLCDAAVEAVNDVDARVAIRGIKSLAALLYADEGHEDIEAGSLRGYEAVRFHILNNLSQFHGRLDLLESRPPSRPELPAIAPGKKLGILVVEDNFDSAETLRRLLELCGYAVTVAHDAREALEAAKRMRPQIVLCDIGLPGSDGFSLAAALRDDPSTASSRLIALTAYGTEIDQARTKKAGFEAHLVKPVSPEVLIQHLEHPRKGEEPEAAEGGV